MDLVNKFDIIYIRDSRFATAIVFSKKLAEKSFIKVGAIIEEEIYTSFMEFLAKALVNSIDRNVIKRSRGLVVPSVNFAKQLILRRRIIPKALVVIPSGITKDRIDIVNKVCSRDLVKRRVEAIILGFLGYLARWQGTDILCDIVAELNKLGYRARLLIIGDGPERISVLRRCSELGVDVEITGFVPHYIALCLARKYFDVLILPRMVSETTSSIVPIKVIEALALGIPVVVTDLPIYNSLKGKGVFVSRRDPKEFAKIIYAILSKASEMNIDYEEVYKYSYENNVRKLLEVAMGSRVHGKYNIWSGSQGRSCTKYFASCMSLLCTHVNEKLNSKHDISTEL